MVRGVPCGGEVAGDAGDGWADKHGLTVSKCVEVFQKFTYYFLIQ